MVIVQWNLSPMGQKEGPFSDVSSIQRLKSSKQEKW